LSWSDVYLERRFLHLDKTKNGTSRDLSDVGDKIDFMKDWGDKNIKDGVGIEVYVGKHKIRNALDLMSVKVISL